MPWPLKPPPQGGELLDRPRPQGIHRGDPQRTEATHACGGTLGRGAGGQVLRWEDEVKKLSNIWGFNSLYSQFHLPICNSYLPRLVIQQFCWELVVWCFFVVHLCFWESMDTMAAGLFFLMGKAVRKMTLSDPWMEGDDFQPGSQLNSCISFGLVGISHFGSFEVLGRHLFGLPNFHGNVRASKVACLYFYALSDNLTLNPRCMFDKCYHWCVRNPVPLSIHTLVI